MGEPIDFERGLASVFNSYIDEMDFTLGPIKKYRFKSSFHWFKIDLYQQLRPLTANCLAMFKVILTTIYT